MSDIDEIKSRINIVDIISERVILKKVGSNYFGLCPFHTEKTPSFSVNENLQIFKCFGCGEGGDVITFCMKINNISFLEALELLASRIGYKLNNKLKDKDFIPSDLKSKKEKLIEINKLSSVLFRQNLIYFLNKNDNNPVKKYFFDRNLDSNLLEIFNIGFADNKDDHLINTFKKKGFTEEDLIESGIFKNVNGHIINRFKERLTFSLYDQFGNIVGFSGRIINSNKSKSLPKYINSSDSIVFNKSKVLFGFHQAQEYIKKNNFVILCEGQMNVISSFRIGVKNIVASLGTSFTIEQLKLLSNITKNIYIAFDKDSAGKKALLRILKMIFEYDEYINVKIVNWDPFLGKDPDEIISKDKVLWIDAVKNSMLPIDYFVNEFKLKYKNPDYSKKYKFIQFIFPLILSHRNLFMQDEFLKSLSFQLGVSIDSMKNYYNSYMKSLSPKKKGSSKINTELAVNVNIKETYERFFALILQNWSVLRLYLRNLDRSVFDENYLVLFDFLILNIDKLTVQDLIGGCLKYKVSVKNKLMEQINNFVLMPLEIDYNVKPEEHMKKMLKNLILLKIRDLRGLYIQKPDQDVLSSLIKLSRLLSYGLNNLFKLK